MNWGLRSSLSAFRRRDEGNATIEFALLFPAFMSLFLASAEVGILTLRNVVLERATDIVVRELRLGIGEVPDHAQLKSRICAQAGLFRDCEDSIHVELQRIGTDTWIPTDLNAADCRDRSEEVTPVVDYTVGASNDLMLIRVCAVFDPFFPTGSLASRMQVDSAGGYALVAASAFVVAQ